MSTTVRSTNRIRIGGLLGGIMMLIIGSGVLFFGLQLRTWTQNEIAAMLPAEGRVVDRSPARRTAVVGHGVGDLVGGERWLCRRGGATSAPGGGIAGNPHRPPARPWPPGAARPALFPSRAVGAVGGLVMRLIPEPWPKSLDTAHAPPSESLPLQNAA